MDTKIRYLPLFIIIFMISSCGRREEKQAAQREESLKQEYLQKGGEIVNLSQSELLKNVSHAMKTGGPEYAIDFCNLHAMEIKDSLSRLNNCQIQRIALKYRNPLDKPQSKKEEDLLYQYQFANQKGDSIKPKIYLLEDRIEYYQPIVIDNGACLICHGDPDTQIADETLVKLEAQYPNDLAVGFSLNDFRGTWKITFMK